MFVLNVCLCWTKPGFLVCHHHNNRSTNMWKIAHTGRFYVLLTNGLYLHCHINPQQVMILSRYVKLLLISSVTMWPFWFNLVSMVQWTQHIIPKWSNIWLHLSQRSTLCKKIQHVAEKLVWLLKWFQIEASKMYARKEKLVLKKTAATSHSYSNTHHCTSMYWCYGS